MTRIVSLCIVLFFHSYIIVSSKNYCTWTGFDHFDHLRFTQVWPTTNCLLHPTTCVQDLVNPHFTIEGIIPELITPIGNHTGPQCCKTNEKFSLQYLSSMYDLNFLWADIGDSDSDLWEQNWNRYGSCLSKNSKSFSFHHFFATALNFYKRFDILQAILAERIFPSSTKMINGTKFVEILQKVRDHVF
jgi:hypothetical protein